ncbi:MAG: hypothetical protein GY915_04900 [bacterium]|nr:hypothetical protein [bacterium]
MSRNHRLQLSFHDEKNGLQYPWYPGYYRLSDVMLPRGYAPQEDHENLGLSFLKATGQDTLEILERVLGIPQAHASVGLLEIQNTGGLQNVLATYGGASLAMGNQAIQTLIKRKRLMKRIF